MQRYILTIATLVALATFSYGQDNQNSDFDSIDGYSVTSSTDRFLPSGNFDYSRIWLGGADDPITGVQFILYNNTDSTDTQDVQFNLYNHPSAGALGSLIGNEDLGSYTLSANSSEVITAWFSSSLSLPSQDLEALNPVWMSLYAGNMGFGTTASGNYYTPSAYGESADGNWQYGSVLDAPTGENFFGSTYSVNLMTGEEPPPPPPATPGPMAAIPFALGFVRSWIRRRRKGVRANVVA